jgi:hypothetical protein
MFLKVVKFNRITKITVLNVLSNTFVYFLDNSNTIVQCYQYAQNLHKIMFFFHLLLIQYKYSALLEIIISNY